MWSYTVWGWCENARQGYNYLYGYVRNEKIVFSLPTINTFLAEGPQFSTLAECLMYRAWGGTIINMSVLPEAKLAREAEMGYQMICMATDYDCWHSTENVDVKMVMGHMAANGTNAKLLVTAVLDELCKESHRDLVKGAHWAGNTTNMLKSITKPEGRGEKGKLHTDFLFPGIWTEIVESDSK